MRITNPSAESSVRKRCKREHILIPVSQCKKEVESEKASVIEKSEKTESTSQFISTPLSRPGASKIHTVNMESWGKV